MTDATSQSQATIGSEWAGAILVLKPIGRIDSNNAGQAEDIVLGHVDQGAQRIALDMSELTYISSAGLRVLLVTAKKLKQTGGRIVLYDLTSNVQEVLEVSGFLAILQLCEGREAALSKLAAS